MIGCSPPSELLTILNLCVPGSRLSNITFTFENGEKRAFDYYLSYGEEYIIYKEK